MYLKTIEAVRKWMLYRPMVPGSNDILFSGAVTTGGKPETDLVLNAEVEHLTCFISGMIGMGAKIFNIKGDLELAIKLADGCVWAYESTPSGIMAEGATVLPCESAEQCTWNETAYFEYLDPMASERDKILEEYLANKVAREAELETAKKATLTIAEADKAAATKAEAEKLPTDKQSPTNDAPPADNMSAPRAEVESRNASDIHGLIQRRQHSPRNELPEPVTGSFADDSAKAKQETGDHSDGSRASADKVYEEKLLSTEAELQGMAAGRQTKFPPPAAQSTLVEELPDPLQPLSHKDFVAARIKQSALPPGYVNIRSRKYILR
jgi:mannosyl-oligosaccharide alpha-1,2-mannosidase